MHPLLSDALTLLGVAAGYVLGCASLRPFVGEYLTKHIIFGLPLYGTQLRFRLHYLPLKDESTHAERVEDGRANAKDPPAISDGASQGKGITFPAMFRQVFLHEGVSGYYKGSIPFLVPFIWRVIRPRDFFHLLGFGTPPVGSVADVVHSICGAMAIAPIVLVANRCISARLLPFRTRLANAERVLFSASELNELFAFVTSPVVRVFVAGQIIHSVYVDVVYRVARWNIEHWADGTQTFPAVTTMTMTRTIVGADLLIIGSVALLCPLEVILARLTVQRWQVQATDVKDQTEEAAQKAEFDCSDSPSEVGTKSVFWLRESEEMYDGIFSCARIIAKEEGLATLWRGWWTTWLWLWLFHQS